MFNSNYATIVKHDIDKLLVARFIQPVNEARWLSPIVVVPKQNGKLRICVDFKKLNKVTKKNPYLLPFSNEVLNIVIRYEAYSFLDGYSRYHQISIAPKDRYKTSFLTNWGAFITNGDAISCKKWATNISNNSRQNVQRVLGPICEFFFDDFMVYNDKESNFMKFTLCF